jgi:hypothetical protein
MPLLASLRTLETGRRLFHHSRFLSELVMSAEFSPDRSNHDGAMFFTALPTLRSNCVTTVSVPLKLSEPVVVGYVNQTEINTEILMGSWRAAEKDGFDGKLYPNDEPYTQIGQGIYCDEIIIFAHALRTLTAIQPFDSLRAKVYEERG